MRELLICGLFVAVMGAAVGRAAAQRPLEGGALTCACKPWACTRGVFDGKTRPSDCLPAAEQTADDLKRLSHKYYFVTKRATKPEFAKEKALNRQSFSESFGEKLTLGSVSVSQPSSRKRGVSFESDKPLNELIPHLLETFDDYGEFKKSINGAGGLQPSEVLLYIHGFGNTFIDGALRLAQVSTDLGLSESGKSDRAKIFFSWPSQPGLPTPARYRQAKEALAGSVPDLKGLLSEIWNKEGAATHIIAHSMGTDLAMQTFKALHSDGQLIARGKLMSLTLTAPDIELDNFTKFHHEHVQLLARTITIYCSPDDKVKNLMLASSLV